MWQPKEPCNSAKQKPVPSHLPHTEKCNSAKQLKNNTKHTAHQTASAAPTAPAAESTTTHTAVAMAAAATAAIAVSRALAAAKALAAAPRAATARRAAATAAEMLQHLSFYWCFEEVSCCLVGFVGLCLAPLVLIIVGFVILVGKSVVIVLLLDLVRLPLSFSWMSFWDYFVILLGLDVLSLAGTLPLRYCAARFACKTPTWRLPVSGHVARLVAIYCEAAGGDGSEVSSSGVHWVSGSGPGRKRI